MTQLAPTDTPHQAGSTVAFVGALLLAALLLAASLVRGTARAGLKALQPVWG